MALLNNNNELSQLNNNINNNNNSKANYPSKNDIDKIIKINKGFMYKLYDNKKLNNNKNFTEHQINIIHEFWQCLSIGNECICNIKDNKEIEYSGVSPDDIELVKASSDMGYTMLKSPNDIKRIMYGFDDNNVSEYKILNTISFTSDRKRSSMIIVGNDNVIKMYIKGADSEIKKRLRNNFNACSGLFTSLKFVHVLTTPTTKNTTRRGSPIAWTEPCIVLITLQIVPPLNVSGV
jgi:magnesium-transporting ATPase (P-type)